MEKKKQITMRSEEAMFDLILQVAKHDDRIRAVYMNGSRTNPNAPKDIFQDYDIVYVVTETASFIQDEEWIQVFGDLLMIQEPDRMDQAAGIAMNFDRSYTYLMLFTDGNRIDLHIETHESMKEGYLNDKLTVPLLDKDQCLPLIPPPTDEDYRIHRPTEVEFHNACNEFWWCLQNVAKGIWRDEMPYARSMYEQTSKAMLDRMVSWWVGSHHNYDVSTGKMGKYFKTFLPSQIWEKYESTYADRDHEQFWDAVFAACELFRTLATDVASDCGYKYNMSDDEQMTGYLKQVQALPHDAAGIYS